MSFISFSCSGKKASSSTILNRSGENGHPCLIHDLREKAFNYSPLSMILAMGCHIWSLLYWGMFLLYLICLEFLSWKMLNFVKCFFCTYWNVHINFIFHSIKVVYHIYWFAYVEPNLHPRDESHLIMVYNLLNVPLNSVC